MGENGPSHGTNRFKKTAQDPTRHAPVMHWAAVARALPAKELWR